MTSKPVLDLKNVTNPSLMATAISNMFLEWNTLRQTWIDEKKELRNYIFATDTRKTSNAKLPWKNSTTIPKLCQIRDNLHANYMAALFPNDEWLMWDGDTPDDSTIEKQKTITGYVQNKTRASGFTSTVSQLVLDLIDYGNCFATLVYVDESTTNKMTGNRVAGYNGAKVVRISPLDIVFNPVASSFECTPKIIRSVKTLGEFHELAEKDPDFKKALDYTINVRKAIMSVGNDAIKDDGFRIDGFSGYRHYYTSGMVEVLTFYGDIFDITSGEMIENSEIAIVDRAFLVYQRPCSNSLGKFPIYHHGWRKRPDNLYAMGALDNLVGMQYRIDHLENLKADAFDMIAFPMLKVHGNVPDFEYKPGERIYTDEEGDVTFLHPDTAALNADNQIAILENKMEEMAGAPKQAMGFRTPGEKTAYEVQTLENAAGRIFQNKTLALEQEFLDKVLNGFLAVSIQYMTTPETIKTLSSDINVKVFQTITVDDLVASGKLRPMGASHFAKRNQFVQNLTNFMSSAVGQDPAVKVHISGKNLAKAAEDLLNLDRFALYKENVRVIEQMETQRLMNAGSEQLQLEKTTNGYDPSTPAPPQG